jgi:O-antigen/teichoic acid export membrane protein
MRDLLKRLAKMVAGYGAVQWAGPLLSLILTPIITRILLPSDYGAADYLQAIATALATVALFALPQAVATHFNDHPDDAAWQRGLTGSALVTAIVLGVGVGLALALAVPALAALSPIVSQYGPLVQFVGLTLAIGLAATILTNSAQSALRVRWGMVFSFTTLIATIAGNVLYIVVLRLGVMGMVLTPITTHACVLLAAAYLMRGTIGRPNRKALQLLLRSGAILLPTTLAVWSLTVIDRLFLGQHVPETELGYYALANKMAGLAYVAMAPIYAAWTPVALAMQHEPHAQARFVNMARYLIAAALIVGLGLGLFAIELLIVLTRPVYFPAAPYVGFLAYMHVFSAFGTVLTTGAMMGKQLRSVSVAIVAGALVNIALNAALIPRFGLWGATAATVIGYAVPPAIMYALLQRSYPIPYPAGPLLAALGLQFALLIAGSLVPAVAFPLRITLKLALLSLLPLGLVAIGVISRFEVRQAYLFARNRIRLLLPA